MGRNRTVLSDPTANWRDKSLCDSVIINHPQMGSSWINEEDSNIAEAKKVCAKCPVRAMCLIDALQDSQSEGLRAGYYFSNGTLSKEDLRQLWLNDRLRGRTRRKTNEDEDDASTEGL